MIPQTIRVLVTGANGQLGQSILKKSKTSDNIDFFFFNKEELDITVKDQITNCVDKTLPDFIINTAAYTQVDKAESEKQTAFLINEKGVENLAKVCKSRNIGLIHISTDYVFNGKNQEPYLETDKTDPQGVYGASKLAGEQAILNSELANYWIIRTSWLYSPFGNNFVKTMLRLAGDKKAINVVNDQLGSPTDALDLAAILIYLLPKLSISNSGIYHFGNRGETNWYDFAKAIFEIKNINSILSPISTSQYRTLAQRPAYSVLDTQKIEEKFNVEIRHWKTALSEMLLTNY